MGKNKELSDYAILPYNVSKIKEKYLIATPFGGWSLLDKKEFSIVNRLSIPKNPSLFNRLKNEGIMICNENLHAILNDFRNLHINWLTDPGLHIVVLTDVCNFNCVYCQAKPRSRKPRMTREVAIKILEFIFCARNPNIRIEFQGGEPLMDWENLQYIVKTARNKNRFEKKNLAISLVTNMSLLDEKKINFLTKHNVDICTSLDGPQFLHDRNRTFESGSGTYKSIIENIIKLQHKYAKLSRKDTIGALPTITRFSLPYPREIVDEYVKLGLERIHLRPLNKLGKAVKEWAEIGYTAEEFNTFWSNSLDYILELNKKGRAIKESLTVFILKKIFKKTDPLYVDLESPCGAGRGQIVYSQNGDIYTCDEARMLNKDVFKLGNVLKDKYVNVMKNENIFYTAQSSLLGLWDYRSAYSCWSGTCPVMNYHQQGGAVVKITQTPKYKIHNFQFEYIFQKIIEDKEALSIFKRWAEN